MSEQEQDAIVGRTMREYESAKRQLALLHAKALDYSQHMKAVLAALPDAKIIPVQDIERCPGSMDLMALFGEIRDTRTKIEELAKTLREMGIG